MDNVQQLRNIYVALNKITICGDENIERMYGCLCALATMIKEAESDNRKDG